MQAQGHRLKAHTCLCASHLCLLHGLALGKRREENILSVLIYFSLGKLKQTI